MPTAKVLEQAAGLVRPSSPSMRGCNGRPPDGDDDRNPPERMLAPEAQLEEDLGRARQPA